MNIKSYDKSYVALIQFFFNVNLYIRIRKIFSFLILIID